MGGLAGVHAFSGASVAAETLHEMIDLLRHRGPDGSRAWIGPDVGLAHTGRTVPAGAGRQPMHSEDGRWVLVLDGEVLNHEALRAHLDHPFRTASDTEVVLAGLALEGISFVERLHGSFALVAHDRRTATTHLVRDRLGMLPLHYRHVDGGIAFASEIKALLAVGTRPEVDLRSLDSYLAGHAVPAPDTLLDGVKKVRPAHRMSVTSGGHIDEVCYWSPPERDPDGTWILSDATEAVADGVREAVRVALVADVPVGACLSDSLDDSIVAAQAQHLLGDEPIHTFAVAFGGPHELSVPHRVSRSLGTRHHEVRVRPEQIEELWTRLTWHRDAPVDDPRDIAAFALALAAREHVGVLVSGDGGEELFGGHHRYRLERVAERSRALPQVLRAGVTGPVERHLGAAFTTAERRRLLGSAAPAERRTPTTPGIDPVDRMLRHDLRHDVPEHLLERLDRMSRATSLELRPALLDHRLVELALRLPASVKLRSGSTQWVLRAAARPLLSDAVLDSARTTLRRGSRSRYPLGPALDRTLDERLTGADSWVGRTMDPTVIRVLLDRHRVSGAADARLWTLLGLELWHDRFLRASPGMPRPRAEAPLLPAPVVPGRG